MSVSIEFHSNGFPPLCVDKHSVHYLDVLADVTLTELMSIIFKMVADSDNVTVNYFKIKLSNPLALDAVCNILTIK